MVLGPNYSVCTVRIGRGDWQQPSPSVCSKHLSKVLVSTHVVYIGSRIRVALTFKVIESRRVAKDEFNMKAEKHGDDNKEGNIDQQKQSTKDENN